MCACACACELLLKFLNLVLLYSLESYKHRFVTIVTMREKLYVKKYIFYLNLVKGITAYQKQNGLFKTFYFRIVKTLLKSAIHLRCKTFLECIFIMCDQVYVEIFFKEQIHLAVWVFKMRFVILLDHDRYLYANIKMATFLILKIDTRQLRI